MKKKKNKIIVVAFLILLIIPSYLFFKYGRSIWHPNYLQIKGKRSVSEVVNFYEKKANSRLKVYFQKANVHYPPNEIALVAFKDSKTLHLWAANSDTPFTLIHSYTIKGASGILGPKLREGDHQVPEGIYKIVGLNPNSSYHLSMKINYPNQFDLKYAKIEGRKNPGSNIFIHGKSGSVGCLAMGDKVIEELFILSNKVGLKNIEVIIAPTNLAEMIHQKNLLQDKPFWVPELYKNIITTLKKFYTIEAG